VPGLAPAAKQGGAFVARHIRARTGDGAPPQPFRYRHRGSLATIGRKSAVVDFGRFRLWGAPAWWLWGLVHLGLLVGVRNRISTMVSWFWSYLTFRSAIRLITGSDPEPRTASDTPVSCLRSLMAPRASAIAAAHAAGHDPFRCSMRSP